VWERARPANDFAAVRPLLETTVELSRELAGYYTGYAHPFDALIDLAEDGMTVAAVRTLFAELRAGLVPLIEAIRARPEVEAGCLIGDFPEQAQQAFGEKAIRAFGYDYTRGRQDKTRTRS
jgi:carboxypeptidase Taq